MALTNVELYEALKDKVGEETARLIAEVYPAARDLATKADVAELKAEMLARFGGLQAQMAEAYGRLDAKIEATAATNLRWVLGVFVPMWAATLGTLFVALLRS